jgi:hypothetical protein
MKEELLKILEKGYEAAIKGGEFILEEGTILIQQFLTWKLFESGFFMMLGIILLFGVPLIIRPLYNQGDRDKFLGKITTYDYANDPNLIMGAIISGLLALAGIIIFLTYLHTFIKILVAPNVYLLEYILKNLSR